MAIRSIDTSLSLADQLRADDAPPVDWSRIEADPRLAQLGDVEPCRLCGHAHGAYDGRTETTDRDCITASMLRDPRGRERACRCGYRHAPDFVPDPFGGMCIPPPSASKAGAL